MLFTRTSRYESSWCRNFYFGSLGQATSVANGMALNAKIYNEDYGVYVILGDGEVQEGQIWEAAMTAPHYKLDIMTVS